MHIMNKLPTLLLLSCSLATGLHAQKVSGKLSFQQGGTLVINMSQKSTMAQQAMGQTIDFKTNATVIHTYKVTNATPDNSTLHHEIKKLAFDFDGMGAKRAFDSDNKKDMSGEFGKPISQILEKTFDIIVDGSGKTLLARPEKVELAQADGRVSVIVNTLKDMTDLVRPPAKGSNSFFKVLPDYEVGVGDTWTDSLFTETERSATINTLSAITDSTIVVDFKTSSVTTNTLEVMGSEAISRQNILSTGKIILDRQTGLIKEKITNSESNGSTEFMGTPMPTTGKMTVHITVGYQP